MPAVNTFACAVCARQRQLANHWRMCWVNGSQFVCAVWDAERAQFPNVHHVCGDGHALTLFSRYLSSGSLSERKSA